MGEEYTVQVSNLASSATEDELCQFFWYCGTVETLKLEKAGSYSKVAFVTFKEPYALETAVLLSGATIAGERVCIQPWGDSEEAVKRWKQDTLNNPSHPQHATPQEDWGSMIPSPGQAANAVSALLSKGYVLGKDALFKAKELDTRYQVSSSAAARVCTLSKNLGITDKINAGTTAVRSVDTRYGISEKGKFVGEKSKYALVAAGNAVSTAGSAVVNSSYFASGALWVSSVLDKAAKSAAELGSRPHK